MISEYIEKLEAQYPGHTFAWATVYAENSPDLLKQLHIDGQPSALWIYPDRLEQLITGQKETAEENFETSLNSFIKFIDDYFNPPAAKNDEPVS